uniref:Uncharacterized protein n=1 Tax=Arundo donax TaxID=35708 RepID=A0A0A8YU76_ARUDO
MELTNQDETFIALQIDSSHSTSNKPMRKTH